MRWSPARWWRRVGLWFLDGCVRAEGEKRENFQSLLALHSLRSRGGSQRESVQSAASPGGRER